MIHYPSVPSNPNEEARAARRRRLLAQSRERIEWIYQEAVEHGIERPVVVVLDLEDEQAVQLAQHLGWHPSALSEFLDECRRRDVIPVQIVAIPAQGVACLVGPAASAPSPVIAGPGMPGTFRVVIVAESGQAFTDVPVP